MNRRDFLKKAAVGSAAIAALPTVISTFSTPASAGEGNAQKIAQGWADAWNSHDVDRVLAVFTDDIFYEDVTFGLVNHGSVELRAFAQFFFTAVPDLQIELVHTAINGGHGSIEWVFSGTDVGVFKTGKPFSVRGASVIDVRGGLISRNSDYYDAAKIMRDVGILVA